MSFVNLYIYLKKILSVFFFFFTVVLESRDENITVVMKITNNTVFFNIFIHYYITSCSNV